MGSTPGAIRIGVALGGGGAAAMAEIGVLEELSGAGIEIECVAGTSAGALVGAAFAAGRLTGLRDSMSRLTRRRVFWLFGPAWPRLALFRGISNMEFVRPHLGGLIEDLPIPFAAVAADLESGCEVVLDRGNVIDAIRASAAIPGLFPPCTIDGRLLMDGGLVDPLPVGVARALGAEFVIAINVLPVGDRTHDSLVLACRTARERQRRARVAERLLGRSTPGIDPKPSWGDSPVDPGPEELRLTAILSRASKIVQAQIAAARLRDQPPEWLIQVPTSDIGLFEFHRTAEAVECGRATARAILTELLDEIACRQSLSPVRRVRQWLRREPHTDRSPDGAQRAANPSHPSGRAAQRLDESRSTADGKRT